MSLFRVTTTLTGDGVTGNGVQRFYFNVAGGTASQAANAAAAWWTGVKDLYRTTVTAAVQTEVPEIDEATGDVISMNIVSGASVAGTASEDPMSPLNQMCVNWRTGHYVAGREVRGRTFIPALTEGDWNSGAWTAGRKTLVETANSTLVGDANSILVVYSPTHANLWPVIYGQVKTKMSYLRSRRD